MHGLGNDYVYVDATKEKIPDKLIKDCKALKSAAWSHVFACWSCGTFFLVCF